jgi:hypothetical protein
VFRESTFQSSGSGSQRVTERQSVMFSGINGSNPQERLNDMRSPAPRVLSLHTLSKLNSQSINGENGNGKKTSLDIDTLLQSNHIQPLDTQSLIHRGGGVDDNQSEEDSRSDCITTTMVASHTYGNEYGLQEESTMHCDVSSQNASDVCNHFLSYQLRQLGHHQDDNSNGASHHRYGKRLESEDLSSEASDSLQCLQQFEQFIDSGFNESRSAVSANNDANSSSNNLSHIPSHSFLQGSGGGGLTMSSDVMSMNGSVCGWSLAGSVSGSVGGSSMPNSLRSSPVLQHCSSSEFLNQSEPNSPLSDAASSVSTFSGRVKVV